MQLTTKFHTLALGAVAALALSAGAANTAQAAGCLKGAVVGGLAGHMANHGVLGAVGGCVVGRHMASKQEKQAAREERMQEQPRTNRSMQ